MAAKTATPEQQIAEMEAQLAALTAEREAAEERNGVMTRAHAWQTIRDLGLTDAQVNTIVTIGMAFGWKFVGRTINGWSLEKISGDK